MLYEKFKRKNSKVIGVLITLLFSFLNFTTFSQSTFQYSYIDPCTGVKKTLSVPSNGITVSYYGQIQTFQSNDFYNGSFENWADDVYNSFGGNNPCASIVGLPTAINIGQTTALNFISILNSLSAVQDAANMRNSSMNLFDATLNGTSKSEESKKKNNESQNTGIEMSGDSDNKNNNINQQSNSTNQSSSNSSNSQQSSNSNSTNNSSNNQNTTTNNTNQTTNTQQNSNLQTNNQSGSQNSNNNQTNNQTNNQSNNQTVNTQNPNNNQTNNQSNNQTGNTQNPNNNQTTVNGNQSSNNSSNSLNTNTNQQSNNTSSQSNSSNTNTQSSQNSANNTNNQSPQNNSSTANNNSTSQNPNNSSNTNNNQSSENSSNTTNSNNGTSQNGELKKSEQLPGDNTTENKAEEKGGGSVNVVGNSVNSVEKSTSNNGKPTVILASDYAGFNFQNNDIKYGTKISGGYTSMRWDGLKVHGIMADYTSSIKGPNVMGFYANLTEKRIDLACTSVTFGLDAKKSIYGTLAIGQMWKFQKPQNLKLVYLVTTSYGNVYENKFIGTAFIAGSMYDWKVNQRFDVKLIGLYVYAPYVKYYNDILLKSPHVILPIVGTNISITKTFKFNINIGGAYAIKENVLNYTILMGTRFIL